MESFDPVTRQGLAISNLFGLELVISAVLLGVVIAWLGVALFRFRARAGDADEPPQVRGNRMLEVVWTMTPALVLAVVLVIAVQTMGSVDAAEPNAQPLRVVGHQWWWEFEYTDMQAITANEPHVPVGKPLLVSLQSADVIHSFLVPQFGWMRDAIPGKTNQMSLVVERPGIFAGVCTQYCGAQHAWMRLRVVAEPVDQFNAWLEQQRQPVVASGARGEQVFTQNTCVNCHAIRGLPPRAPTARVAPDLTHFGSRATLGAGVVDNTPDNLRRWIRNPQTIKPGALMPGFTSSLSEDDLRALVDYLEGLK